MCIAPTAKASDSTSATKYASTASSTTSKAKIAEISATTNTAATTKKTTKAARRTGRNWLSGNGNIYWATLCPSMLVWFMMGIPRVFDRHEAAAGYRYPPFLVLHLAGAVGTCVCCMVNLYKPPSTLPAAARSLHSRIGRVGLVCSFVGLVLGFAYTWVTFDGPLGVRVGLSIVGVLQARATYKGWASIRRAIALKRQLAALKKQQHEQHEQEEEGKAGKEKVEVDVETEGKAEAMRREHTRLINEHRDEMCRLFYGSCAGPFWFRVPKLVLGLVLSPSHPLVVSRYLMFSGLLINILVGKWAARATKNRTWL